MFKQAQECIFIHITPFRKCYQWHKCYDSAMKPAGYLLNNQHACQVMSWGLIKDGAFFCVLLMWDTHVWHRSARQHQILPTSEPNAPTASVGHDQILKVPPGEKQPLTTINSSCTWLRMRSGRQEEKTEQQNKPFFLLPKTISPWQQIFQISMKSHSWSDRIQQMWHFLCLLAQIKVCAGAQNDGMRS